MGGWGGGPKKQKESEGEFPFRITSKIGKDRYLSRWEAERVHER